MTSFGLTLSSEEHAPRRLVEIGPLAEEHGFDFVSISDHFHPWVDAQGHSPFVWSVLGALAERTTTLDVAVGVTCPIMRIHPAVLAQAAATTAQLLEGRFTWGVGTGEALNEHILGEKWPTAPERLEMLEEAIDVIRRLWSGDEVTFTGRATSRSRTPGSTTRPTLDIPIIVSAFATAGRQDGGRGWATACGPAATPDASRRGSGGRDRAGVQADRAVLGRTTRTTRSNCGRGSGNGGVPGQLSQDLPTPAHFDRRRRS